ncbi:MAG TPA: hypothetical protein VE153_27735 [Myxococcus sp.]|nr:hypothetical protein [Myxococcus sp.]
MKSIQQYLTNKQAEFSQHAFFTRLAQRAPLSEVLPFAKSMSFWIMSFQDILRLNETRVTDPELKKIAYSHKAEDAGHELWFLNDLITLEDQLPDIRFLFGRSHAETRDASYALVAEVFQAQSDAERIALVLALESTGHVFFERIATYLEETGYPRYNEFRYFSRKHLDVELDHEVFEDEKEALIENLPMTPAQEQACMALVDRIYVAFTTMFDHLETITRRTTTQPAPAPQRTFTQPQNTNAVALA